MRDGEWMGTLSQIVDGRAYFVRSTTFDPIKVLTERFSPQRTPSQYVVTAGWNGIGYTPAGNEEEISVDAYLSSLGASGMGHDPHVEHLRPPRRSTRPTSPAARRPRASRMMRAVLRLYRKARATCSSPPRNGVIGG